MKRFTGVAVVAFTALLLARSAAAQIRLHYAGIFEGTRAGETAVIERFNELYKGEIEVTIGPPIPPQDLLVRVVAGGAPDVVKFDRFNIAEWAHEGLLYPLDDYIVRDGIDPADFFPAAWNEQVYRGKTYGLPWNIDVRVYLYNKEAFADSGLDPEAPPRTWRELDHYAQALDRRSIDAFQRIGFAAGVGNWYYLGWLFTAGGEVVDPEDRRVMWDSEEGIRAAEYVYDFAQRYGGAHVIRTRSASPGIAVATGEFASILDGSWALGAMLSRFPSAEVGVAPPPRPEGLEHEPTSWSGGFAIAIPINTPPEKIEAAWTFIKYFTSAEIAAEMLGGSGIGQLPPRRSAILSPAYADNAPPQLFDFLAILPYSRFRPAIPMSGELFNLYQRVEPMMFDQGFAPANAVRETARLGQALLDEWWARQ